MNPVKKLAFCFLTYGDLSQPKLWDSFFPNDEIYHSIYIHNKTPLLNETYKKYCLKQTIPTQWGKVSIVKATLCLLMDAYNDPDNEYFALLSDKCIPIRNFKDIYQRIMIINNNIISCWSDPGRHKGLADKSFFKESEFKKQNQWMILKRQTVKHFLNHDYLTVFGDNFFAADEHYFVNICHKFKIDYVNSPVTFVNWDEHSDTADYNILPKTYGILSNEQVAKIISVDSYLFMRKVSDKCVLPAYFEHFTPLLNLQSDRHKIMVICGEERNNRQAWELAQTTLSPYFNLDGCSLYDNQGCRVKVINKVTRMSVEYALLQISLVKQAKASGLTNLIVVDDDIQIINGGTFFKTFRLIIDWLENNIPLWEIFNGCPIEAEGPMSMISDKPSIIGYKQSNNTIFQIYNSNIYDKIINLEPIFLNFRNSDKYQPEHLNYLNFLNGLQLKYVTTCPFLVSPKPDFNSTVKSINPYIKDINNTIKKFAESIK